MRNFVRNNYFLLRRLHSLSGIIPFGGFLLLHMFLNSRAAQSPEAYQWVPDTLDQIPFLFAIEIFGLLLPMAFHAGLGVIIALNADYGGPAKMRSNAEHWGFIFQRVSGVLLLVLLVVHLMQTWWPHVMVKLPNMLDPAQPHGEFDIYGLMNGLFSHSGWIVVYGLFVVLAAFHFGNGLYNFAFKWGFSTSRASQKGAIALGLGVAFLCIYMGFSAIWGMAFSPWAQDYDPGAHGGNDHGSYSRELRGDSQ